MVKKWFLTSMLLLTVLLSSCLPFAVQASQPTPNSATREAILIPTLFAYITQTAAANPTATATNTRRPNTATPTPRKKASKTPTTRPSRTPVPIPCDQAAFVSDVTIPDGTGFTPGTPFTKVWRLQNTGSCSWTPDYQVVFKDGDSLNAPTTFDLPAIVNPGQMVDISIPMQAPSSTGSYEGFWKLQDPDGTQFGVGKSGVAAFTVIITVGVTPIPFAVTHVLTSVDSADLTTPCPPGHRFTLTANIFTNGSGTVTYAWEFSDGSVSAESSLDFPGAGTRTVTTTFRADVSGDYWGQVRIDQPNHQSFEPIDFSLTCQ